MTTEPVAPVAPCGLYRFYNSTGDLLYVGISLNPGARWKQHRADKPWWFEVANVTLEHHPGRATAEAAEREAIRNERPRYNLAHNHTEASGLRAASMLQRMPEPPERFRDACPDCGTAALPRELHMEDAGWLAVYGCCDGTWTKDVAA